MSELSSFSGCVSLGAWLLHLLLVCAKLVALVLKEGVVDQFAEVGRQGETLLLVSVGWSAVVLCVDVL